MSKAWLQIWYRPKRLAGAFVDEAKSRNVLNSLFMTNVLLLLPVVAAVLIQIVAYDRDPVVTLVFSTMASLVILGAFVLLDGFVLGQVVKMFGASLKGSDSLRIVRLFALTPLNLANLLLLPAYFRSVVADASGEMLPLLQPVLDSPLLFSAVAGAYVLLALYSLFITMRMLMSVCTFSALFATLATLAHTGAMVAILAGPPWLYQSRLGGLL